MSPDQLSAKGSEHGIQAAFFCWASMATLYGYAIADDMTAYNMCGLKKALIHVGNRPVPVHELEWMHAIPNGGKRDAASAAMLKAEGVKPGIPDVFLPTGSRGQYGLYIEFKTTSGKQSTEQKAFELYCHRNNYRFLVCRSWREAAEAVKEYLG